jgi:Bacterial mobilisation protein (MobC)
LVRRWPQWHRTVTIVGIRFRMTSHNIQYPQPGGIRLHLMKPDTTLKQDIANGTDISGPGAVRRPILVGRAYAGSDDSGKVVKGIANRERGRAGWRAREDTPRLHLVKFVLTDLELAELGAAASRAGLANGAFAAEAALAAAHGSAAADSSPLRDALVELMRAAGLVRRIGVNLNQVVARLNSTGQRGDDLTSAAEMCSRVIRRLDDAAEQVRRSIP